MSGEAQDVEGYVVNSFLDMSPVRRQQSLAAANDKELPPLPNFSRFTSVFYSTGTPSVSYVKRLSLFILLEVGYIILAALSLRNPIFVGFPDNLDETKGGFTVLFILWQTIAVFPLQHIIFCIFSHEWSIRWSRSKTPLADPNRIDQVSVITSNTPERIRYLARGNSSNSFKLAFATSIVLLGLVKLGPGAVGVATVRRLRSAPIILGNLTLTKATPNELTSVALQRAQMVVGLEQLGSSSHGFGIQSNHIVGWPSSDVTNARVELSYPSDVVAFDYACRWEAPSLSAENSISAGGEEWTLSSYQTNAPLSPDGGIVPVTPDHDSALSAYLFYGSNETYEATNSSRYVLNLGSIPSLVNVTRGRYPQLPVELSSPLLSILICDPHIRITGGNIRLLLNGSLIVDSSDLPPVGNIPQPAANFLFSQGLLASVQPTYPIAQHLPLSVNLVSSRIFLDAFNPANFTSAHQLLSLDAIARNMNLFLLSASKAFVDGYTPGLHGLSTNTFATMHVQGTVQEEVISLTASEALLIITIILSLLAVLLTTILCMNVSESLQLFNLDMITQTLEKLPPRPTDPANTGTGKGIARSETRV